ncbi:carboxypeptidase-like regulatory domain-containing protein [Capnocytophaga ochracea]|uniref:Carboxypeptidase-like regulatory domain-containing protein n=1 Tax=Capnocytophaga ochracea TaxID=1018 RepID=A0AA46W7A5_CAPOC|nr:carboxypeptidase-like regulatory domain-containing protein [Capnocytophaga ochracea]UZD40293.1 carboxypeptidase-like regulatory domain-containing protein [Capnocytophaga ochracea]
MKQLLFVLLFIPFAIYSQVAELTLLDATTKQTIANAEVYYANSLNGSITNEEGKARIFVENDTLTLSHIGYETKKIFTNKTFTKATLYLNPQEIQLDEVVLYNFDLKKKVKYVLDNYFKLYDTKAKILECTYREKFIRNDTLTRLYQVQLSWWSKSYRYASFNQPLEKLLQIQLKNIDYSKMLSEDEVVARSVHLERTPMFMYLFVNTYLSFINQFGENIEIKKVEKSKDVTKVTFNADIVINKKLVLKLEKSVLVFDNTTNAVRKVIFNDIHRGMKDKISDKTKTPYKSITDNYRLELTLTDYKGKLLFSSYYVRLIGAIEYKGKRDKLFLEHSFLRTGVENKHIKKEDRIDIQKSFHEYVTPHKQGEAKFLLTKEEQDFINQ